jgi:DNA-binding FrmR family transcriptional regulator
LSFRRAGSLPNCQSIQARQEKLIARVRRIRGQAEAIERGLASDEACSKVLQTVAACRGALTALSFEILEYHIRFHVMDPEAEVNSPRARAGEELIDVVRAYLK